MPLLFLFDDQGWELGHRCVPIAYFLRIFYSLVYDGWEKEGESDEGKTQVLPELSSSSIDIFTWMQLPSPGETLPLHFVPVEVHTPRTMCNRCFFCIEHENLYIRLNSYTKCVLFYNINGEMNIIRHPSRKSGQEEASRL